MSASIASTMSVVSFTSQSSATTIHDTIQHLDALKQDLVAIQDSQQLSVLREEKAALESTVSQLQSEKEELEGSIRTMKREKACLQNLKHVPAKKSRNSKNTTAKKWRRMIRSNRLQSIILL